MTHVLLLAYMAEVVGLRCPCDVVSLSIIAIDGHTLKVFALVLPHICDTITSQRVESLTWKYPHLVELDLADKDDSDLLTIDLLIGADHYWTLVSG